MVLSYALWTRLFHSDPNIVGRSVTLNGFPQRRGTENNQFTIVRVLLPDFLLNLKIMATVSSPVNAVVRRQHHRPGHVLHRGPEFA